MDSGIDEKSGKSINFPGRIIKRNDFSKSWKSRTFRNTYFSSIYSAQKIITKYSEYCAFHLNQTPSIGVACHKAHNMGWSREKKVLR